MTDQAAPHRPPHGAVQRVLSRITIGTHQAIRARDDNRARNKPREMEQQFQYAISGLAAPAPTFAELTIEFENAFHFAPAQRESNLEYPHFTYGSQTSPAVGVHATVTEWIRDETNGSIIGAKVAVGAVGASVAFTGVVHLTFQGFGTLNEEDAEPLVNEG